MVVIADNVFNSTHEAAQFAPPLGSWGLATSRKNRNPIAILVILRFSGGGSLCNIDKINKINEVLCFPDEECFLE